LRLVRSVYYMPAEVAAVWDRANATYGIHENGVPFYRWLASPRLRKLGYQNIIKNIVVRRLSTRWRHAYAMDVTGDTPGAGLLVVAVKDGH
ncbi:MAG: hypothetical protein P1S60_15505, partial [Anaerolineae bacterium]|nr:hypothetical protein [Anaerolineae bacterium]